MHTALQGTQEIIDILKKELLLHSLNWTDTFSVMQRKEYTAVSNVFSQWFGLQYYVFLDLSRVKLTKVVRDRKWPEGKQKLLQVSTRFELSRVQVTNGKITVNV